MRQGEIANAKIQIGKKSRQYTINWMDPQFKDTNWRIGFDANYTHSTTVSDNFDIDTGGGTIFASYPFNNFWTGTIKTRIRNAVIKITNDAPKIPKADVVNGQVTNEKEISDAIKLEQEWNEEKIQQERNARAQKRDAQLDQSLDQQLGPEQMGLVVAHYGTQVAVEPWPPTSKNQPQRCHFRANLGSLVTGDSTLYQ